MKTETQKTHFLFLFVMLVFADFIGGKIFTFIQDARERRLEEYRIQEAASRIEVTPYHHSFNPHAQAWIGWGKARYRLNVNSLGFRDRSTRVVPLRSSNYRLLFIGDSFLEGMGFKYEKTAVGMIDDKLKNSGIEVLNAAVVSYSPLIYYKKIEYLLESTGLQLNEVVTFIDLSDVRDEASYYELDENGHVRGQRPKTPPFNFEKKRRLQSLRDYLKRNSLFFEILVEIRRYLFFRPPAVRVLKHEGSMWTIDEKLFNQYGRVGLLKGKEHMNALLKVLQKHSIPLTIAVYPWPDQIAHRDLNSRQVLFWKEWARRHQVGFINYFPYFVNGRPWRRVLRDYFVSGDVHWNEAGNHLIADIFLEKWVRAR